MKRIHCFAKRCIHNVDEEYCTVENDGSQSWIDISENGKCIDFTVKDEDGKLKIIGRKF